MQFLPGHVFVELMDEKIMESEKKLLRVRMFGKERITYADKQIMSGRNSLTKTIKLFLILVYSGKNGIPRSKLVEDLFDRNELADAANNLRVTLHRLKKMLVKEGLPEYEYIVSKGGIYYWNSPMETEVDALVFKELIEKSKEETDTKKSMEILQRACELYSGEFLQKLSGDEWVLLESVQYKKQYTDALQKVCDYLMEQKEYQEVLKLVETACEIYPFDEWQSVKIDCFIAMNRYKDAMKEYETTAQMLVEELGISPPERMMNQFNTMSTHIKNRPQIICEIQKGLQEETEEKGAFFCTLPGFRDAYRVIRRGMERNGQSIFLLVCSLVDSKGHPMEGSDKQEEMAEELFWAIKNSLRKGDSFTKYNQTQFLALLMGTNEENCQIAVERISGNFVKKHKSWGQYLKCNVSSLYDIKNQEELGFGTSNLINICVDDNCDGELRGRLYHCYAKQPVIFSNVVELVTKMEQIYDNMSFPQASTKSRSFVETEEQRCQKFSGTKMKQEELAEHKGTIGTFITRVKFRQNSTWQGEIHWMEEDVRRNFTNMLDLVKLIDNTMNNIESREGETNGK